LVYGNTPLCRRCVVAWMNLTDSLGDGLDANQGADNLLKVVVSVNLAGARLTEVTNERLTHNRIVRALPRTIFSFVFLWRTRRSTRAECTISASIFVGPGGAAINRRNVINAWHLHHVIARPTLGKSGSTSRMNSQASEAGG
jgi:hypothetical protein